MIDASQFTTASIGNVVVETPSIHTFVLDTAIDAKPGQYIGVRLGVDERPFGLVAGSPLTFTVANIGPFTSRLHALVQGDIVSFRGPFGNGFTPQGFTHLLVAGGYGVAPLYFLATTLANDPKNTIHVVAGAKTSKDLLFVSRFEALGCMLHIATDDGSAGFHGFSPDVARMVLEREKIDSVYMCGPPVMMKKIAKICADNSVPCEASIDQTSLPHAPKDIAFEARGRVVDGNVLLLAQSL